MQRLVKLEKICEQFHLSLQSGCDETLKRMNRRYTTQQFEEIVKRLRKAYDNVNLTTDIIVGFPGETEEEFAKTYKFLEKIKFYKMHIFKYSPRKGTGRWHNAGWCTAFSGRNGKADGRRRSQREDTKRDQTLF